VAALCHFGDELGIVRDGHAEQEERRACPEVVEEIEEGVNVARELRPRPVPVRVPEPPVHELVPVLEVDAEQESGPRVHAGEP
jgi:hypothetical protein